MAHTLADHAKDVAKHTPRIDTVALEGVVKYLGIALRSRDGATVAAADPTERRRLRESFLKRRLRLTEPDDHLDEVLDEVLRTLAGDRQKSRVTVCYLLAERFGKLAAFE